MLVSHFLRYHSLLIFSCKSHQFKNNEGVSFDEDIFPEYFEM